MDVDKPLLQFFQSLGGFRELLLHFRELRKELRHGDGSDRDDTSETAGPAHQEDHLGDVVQDPPDAILGILHGPRKFQEGQAAVAGGFRPFILDDCQLLTLNRDLVELVRHLR